MRRKDRAVVDLDGIEEIIKICKTMHIGFYDGTKPYVVPVNFGYEYLGGKFTLFFHGAMEGKKVELSKNEPLVAFEITNEIGATGSGENGCQYSYKYRSVMGNGKIYAINNFDEKIVAFNKIMGNVIGSGEFTYGEKMINSTNVYKLEVDEITGKQKV